MEKDLTSNHLKIAILASVNAGKAILEIYDGAFDVVLKSDNSPLTEADKRANTIINTYLKDTGIPIISEESKQIDYSTRKKWEDCWIVDPLDGTKEFIKKNGEFTVNIALVKQGNPIIGVIYVPVIKTLYFADTSSKMAYKVEEVDHTTPMDSIIANAISIYPTKGHSDFLKIVASRSHMSQETLEYINLLKKGGNSVEYVSKGSSLKFCLVAEGLADIYPRFAPTMEWDTAAGQAICNAVGLNVISEDTKAPLRYNKENLLNPFFVVS